MGKEIGGRFKRERAYVYLWLIYVDVWQKPTKFYKAVILQLKNKLKKNHLFPILCFLTNLVPPKFSVTSVD